MDTLVTGLNSGRLRARDEAGPWADAHKITCASGAARSPETTVRTRGAVSIVVLANMQR